MTTDNGGPTTECSTTGQSNWPLRGSKCSYARTPPSPLHCAPSDRSRAFTLLPLLPLLLGILPRRIWEGGTRGAGFLVWAGLPSLAQGLVYTGLIHACDWLPTALSAIGEPVKPDETLPLDGIDMWATLLSNATSPRTEIYYGINQ
eukprot:COSAG05_NODE_11235_length_523_cov_1.332547_1_plen_145_part_10